MDSDPLMHKYNWGEDVKVHNDAPEKFRPSEIGTVCGIYQLLSEGEAENFGCPVGTTLYTIEFGEGQSIEIPEYYLDALPEVN